MKWCAIDDLGTVTMCGEVPDNGGPYGFDHIDGHVIKDIEDGIAPMEHYYRDGSFFAVPEKPHDCARWQGPDIGWVIDDECAATEVRQDRDRRLAASDWTQLPDVPLANREAWAVYRQALRDVTEQVGFPFDVVWPASPP